MLGRLNKLAGLPRASSSMQYRLLHAKIVSPPMVYISGEEMTRYCMELILEKWVKPHIDIGKWEYYDLSVKARDNSDDKVLHDAVAAGARLCAIFKEPTVTPTLEQKEKLGLKKVWGSPNGAMRRGWNGITISRDTIHIEGIELGFKKPVLFERHAVGGEYSAGWKPVGKGKLVTTFFPEDDSGAPFIVDSRSLKDKESVAVVYDNPLDNVHELAHYFFKRCLDMKVVPYVVTKKTVFKWQEGFWRIMKEVFDKHYKKTYMETGLVKDGKLQHLISDAATMQIIRWTQGGFGMAAHNYDGDMLTDEISQVHRSPGFITSNLIGKRKDGVMIKEFEASHGTVADLWEKHKRGEETSMNPLGMVEALIGALEHAAHLEGKESEEVMKNYTNALRKSMHNTFRYGQGTRDMSGPEGLTTEAFIDKVGYRLDRYLKMLDDHVPLPTESTKPSRKFQHNYNVDKVKIKQMFEQYDKDKSGLIDLDEFEAMVTDLGVAPLIKAEDKSNRPR